MRRVLPLVGLLIVLLASKFAGAAEWPQFLGPSRNGFSPEKVVNRAWNRRAPKLLWKISMGDQGYAGPSVAAGSVFILDHQGDEDIVRALDIRTGKPRWEYRYRDARNNNYGFSRSTPTAARGKVYTISRLGQVTCLNAKTGKKVWSRNLTADFGGMKPNWDYSMSALVDGNNVIVCPGGRNAAVAALNADTGRTVWQGGGSDIPGYATPVAATLNGVRQYVVFTGKSMLGVNAGSGKLIWRFPWETFQDVNAATPVVSGNTVFITSGYGHGCALVEVNGSSARAKWESKAIQSHFSTPLLSGGYIYGSSDPSKLVCLELATGRVRWEQRGFEKGGVMGIDGLIIAIEGGTGNVALVKMTPAGYQELGRFRPLGGQSWTAPIVAEGKLLVRNQRELACFDLK